MVTSSLSWDIRVPLGTIQMRVGKLPRQSAPQLIKRPSVCCHAVVIDTHITIYGPLPPIVLLSTMNECMCDGDEKEIAKIGILHKVMMQTCMLPRLGNSWKGVAPPHKTM